MTDEPVKILLIEDNPGDARLIREMLRELTADRFALEQVDRLATGLARLAEGGINLVLLDLSLPDSQGLDTVARTRAQAPDASIVVLTGNDDEALALKTLEIGAEDHLFKGDVDERTLSRAIRYAIERQQFEEALRASEARFRGLLEFAPDAVLIVNREGRITFANPQAEKMFGYRRDELLSGSVDMLVPDHVRERHARHRVGYMGAPRARPMDSGVELRGRRKDGSEFDVDIMLGPLEREGELSVLCIVRDISERKRAEEALRESMERYHRTLDNMLEGCQIIDFNWRYLYVNDAVTRHGRQTREALLDHTMMEVYPGIGQTNLYATLRRCMDERTPHHLENEFTYPDGTAGWFELSIQPVPEGLFILSIDITERKRAEAALAAKNEELRAMTQQLWQTAKLATMGELAASIAHELNNPLGTVSLRVEGLLAHAPPDSPQRRALEVVAREVERMGALVAGLLHFSRRGARQISSLDVRDELEKTLELIHYQLRQRQISVQREFASVVPLVQADRQQLRQVFLNLFTNASDAMPQGGTLTIRVQGEAGQVRMDIADTGVGIAAEDLPKVAEPFFTTKPEGKGTGLGLAICRRILQEHGGTLALTSAGVGQGATVHLTLPTVPDAAAQVES